MNKRWVACDIEDDYFGDDRKLSKQDRKRASAKDRSKYKKTDQEKRKVKEGDTSLPLGRVLSINPAGYIVNYEGVNYTCTLKGALKKEKNQLKNLVAVGDYVRFDILADEEGSIAHVEPRRSVLSRADNLSRRKEQIIASNIDQVLITASVSVPPLKPSLVDRYIIAAEKGNMQPIIVVNKIDLLDEDEEDLYEMFLEAYQAVNIPVIAVSTKTGEGMEALSAIMKDKTSVFSGQSGVGKTSLINAVLGTNYRVGETVDRTKKGAHTTTTAQLIPLKEGGWCIDTPGIKSFGVWDLQRDEVEAYFSEIHDAGIHCKFPDCSHRGEEGCAVENAVEEGKISPLRFESYLMLLESIEGKYLRR